MPCDNVWLYAVPLWVRAVFRPSSLEQELNDEVAFHLAMQTDANRQAGMSASEADRRARLALGGVDQVKERTRDVRPLRWLRDFLQDLRYTFRGFRRALGFTTAAVVTLALGLGANTAMFSVVSAVLLQPLPYPAADRLVLVWTAQPQKGLPRTGTALPDYRAWRHDNHALEDLGAFHAVTYTVTGPGRPEVLAATRMTSSLWTVLRTSPLYGRVFSAADEQWGAHRVVVLSEALWRRRFGGNPEAIGQTIQLDEQPFQVVGVMPANFTFPGVLTEAWTPIAFAPGDDMDSRNNHFVDMLGRLKPGVAENEALADLSVIAARLKHDFPENAAVEVALQGWHESLVGSIRSTLLLLFGTVAFVLLIACANVATLVLVRAASREQELAVRATIGASRDRLMRQLLTEHLTLACLGALLGVMLALALMHAVAVFGPRSVPFLSRITLDRGAIGFVTAIALFTGVAVGLWPARQAAQTSVSGRLNESARTVAGGHDRTRARRVLVIAEVSLSLVLLVGATLLIISLQRLQRVDPGFDVDRLFTATITLPSLRYRDAEAVARFIQAVTDRVAAVPGIRAVGTTTTLPLGGNEWGKHFSIDGRPAPSSLAQVPNVNFRQVTHHYLQTMQASVRSGRIFSDEDGPGRPLVAVVNEALARRFWPNQNPIGQRISMTPPESLLPQALFPAGVTRLPYRTVVGVVQDFRQAGLDTPPNPEVFVPVDQLPPGPWKEPFAQEFALTHVLVARTTGSPLAVTAAIQREIGRIDPSIALANVRTMESRLSDSIARRRFATLLLSGFAGLALVLALVGLYGVMAYSVSQRRKELGVRAALGASAADLIRMVMADGLQITGLGTAVGLVLAGMLSRVIAAQLFDVAAIDPIIYGSVAVLFLGAACLASAVPALRAARADPAEALRSE